MYTKHRHEPRHAKKAWPGTLPCSRPMPSHWDQQSLFAGPGQVQGKSVGRTICRRPQICLSMVKLSLSLEAASKDIGQHVSRGGHHHLQIGRMLDIDLISEPPFHDPSPQMYVYKVWESVWPEGQEAIHSQDVTYLSLHPMPLPPRV